VAGKRDEMLITTRKRGNQNLTGQFCISNGFMGGKKQGADEKKLRAVEDEN
jgi:hypothetical protein